MFYRFDAIPFAKDRHMTVKKLDAKSMEPKACEEIALGIENRKKFHLMMEKIQSSSKKTFLDSEIEECVIYLDQCTDFAKLIRKANSSPLEFEYYTFGSDKKSFTVQGSNSLKNCTLTV